MKYTSTFLYATTLFAATILPPATQLTAQEAGQKAKMTLSLDKLYALADSSSKTIRIFEYAVQGSEADISIAKNACLPEINLLRSGMNVECEVHYR